MSGVAQILAMPSKKRDCAGPPELVEELQAYSNLPGFGEQIRAIAADWLTDGIALIVRAARALNIICILMVGGLVILMVTGITSIQQQIAIGIGG